MNLYMVRTLYCTTFNVLYFNISRKEFAFICFRLRFSRPNYHKRLRIDSQKRVFTELSFRRYLAAISYAVTSLDKQNRLRLQRTTTLHGRLI